MMRMNKKTRTKFVRYLGKQMKEDVAALQIYSRDLSKLPNLTKLLFNSTPDGIILPRNTEDLQRIYNLATETKTPIIPRSGGTTGFGGSIPYNKGLVIDCKGLDRELLIEPIDQTVTISPSIIFSELQKKLKLQGFSLYSYPSSFHSATVAGWISHGGHGIGSIKYGSVVSQIAEMQVVLPNGDVKTFSEKEDISLFFGSNGTLGIISEIKLKIKFDIPLKQFGCIFDSPVELMKGLKELQEVDPYSVWFLNPSQVSAFNDSFGYNLPHSYVAIISKEISYEEEELTFSNNFNNTIRKTGGQILDKRYIMDIWDFRFKTFALLKEYPDFLVSEVILPIETSAKYLRKLTSLFEGSLRVEGELISSTHYSLLLYHPIKEPINDFKKTLLMLKINKHVLKSKKIGGFPYSTGLWFAGYYSQIYGKEMYKRYKDFKKKVDPKNISNPGKVCSPKMRIFPLFNLKFVIRIASEFL
jgi:glycolate oxidase